MDGAGLAHVPVFGPVLEFTYKDSYKRRADPTLMSTAPTNHVPACAGSRAP